MRVLLAPAAFRGTLTAAQAAEAMAEGWSRAAPGDEVRALPLSDGGEGFVGVLSSLPGSRAVATTVQDPLGDLVPAEILLVEDAGGTTAYVEAAQACGPALLPPDRRDVVRSSSYGVGQLVREAVRAGAARVVVGVRDLLVNDGGLGLWQAVVGEGRHTLQEWSDAQVQGEGLSALASAREALSGVTLEVATPEDLPLLGLQGASAQQAADRGASPLEAQELERRLGELVAAVGRTMPPRTDLLTGKPVRLDRTPGAGAGGGVAYGLLALGARVVPGAALVAGLLDLDEAIAGADLVVSGEGRLDWASLRGRVVAVVGEAALRHVRPAVVIPGQSLVGRRETAAIGVSGIYPVADSVRAVPRALADPAGTLAARAERVARTWSR